MAKFGGGASGGSGGGGDKDPQASIAGMVLVRLFLGGFFIYMSLAALSSPDVFVSQVRVATSVNGMFFTGNVWPEFAGFLARVVSPQAVLFAWLVMLGEFALGVLFLLGLLTRLAALLAIVCNGLFLLATLHIGVGHDEINAYNLGLNAGFLAMELAVLIAAAGRTWGLDRLIARKTKIKLLW